MLSDEDCQARAMQCLDQIAKQCSKDLVLMPQPVETPLTYVYSYETTAYLMSGDCTQALADKSLILVSKVTGGVEIAGDALRMKDYIREFEAKASMSIESTTDRYLINE